jgi:hypothetical protein
MYHSARPIDLFCVARIVLGLVPNAVTLHDYFCVDHQVFHLMPYAEHKSADKSLCPRFARVCRSYHRLSSLLTHPKRDSNQYHIRFHTLIYNNTQTLHDIKHIPALHFIDTFFVKLLNLSAFFLLRSISTSTLTLPLITPAFVFGATV